MEQAFGLEIFTPDGAAVAGLTAFRISGVIWTAPVLSMQSLSAQLKSLCINH